MNAYAQNFCASFPHLSLSTSGKGKKVFWSVKPRQVGIYDFSLIWNLLSAGMNRMVHTAEFCKAGKDKELSHGSRNGHQLFNLRNFATSDS